MPEINSGLSVEEKNATVSLTKEGEFFLNGEKVQDETALEEKLVQLTSGAADEDKKEVVVKADEHAKSSEIMKIMRAAQAAGFEKLIVAGEPLSKKRTGQIKRRKCLGDPYRRGNTPGDLAYRQSAGSYPFKVHLIGHNRADAGVCNGISRIYRKS